MHNKRINIPFLSNEIRGDIWISSPKQWHDDISFIAHLQIRKIEKATKVASAMILAAKIFIVDKSHIPSVISKATRILAAMDDISKLNRLNEKI